MSELARIAACTFTSSKNLAKDAQEWCRDRFPHEAGGFVINGEFVGIENASDEPLINYKPELLPRTPAEAFIHSHTQDASTEPSRLDMASQQAAGIPYGIIATDGEAVTPIQWFGDQLPIQPLLGRQFVSGVSDCWCLVRDVYRGQFGIQIHNVPRDNNWFKAEPPHNTPQNLFSMERIIDSGFVSIQKSELLPGDIVAGRVGCSVVNHCGLVLGNNMVLHQLDGDGRLSRREPIRRWLGIVSHCARHQDHMEDPSARPEIILDRVQS